jgi:hypothetical protein
MGYEVDPVTKSVVMTVTDFAEEDDIEDSQLLWDQQISDLRRVLGA